MLSRLFTNKLLTTFLFITGTTVFSHAQFSPDQIEGMEIWLAGDSGITQSENLVSQWNDLGPQQRNATSFAASIQPEIIPDGLNGHQVISFDGVFDFLEFNVISNCRTIFWVMRENEQADASVIRSLLGFSGAANFLRGPNRTFWDSQYSHAGVRNGITRLNLQQIDPFSTIVPNEYFIASLQTSENVQATHITMELGVYGRTWWGELAELIVYNTALTPEEVDEVENYLAVKYGPPLIGMEDVDVTYGFCPVDLCASPGFSTYEWSTNQSGACISVQQPGEYSVIMTDHFGRIEYDTVSVSYPGNLAIPDTAICAGEPFHWDTGLGGSPYTFDWSDDSTTGSITLYEEGDYTLTVTDDNNCESNIDFHVDVDSLDLELSLGPDLQLCSGNLIGLLPHPYSELSFLWGTNASSSEIAITTTGDYNVQVTDMNGCVFRDTVHVVILGTAPLIGFSTSGLCEDASSNFLASSDIPLTSANWNFGDQETGSGLTVDHTFTEGADYNVTLNVMAANGCSGFHQETLHVYQKPNAIFSTNQLCNNVPIIFTDNSTSAEGNIIAWNWMIDGTFYETSSVTADITSSGFQNILLEITDDNNCSSEISSFIDVKASPLVQFTVSNPCEGLLTQFHEDIDASQSGTIISYTWMFGDNTGSVLPNPTHYYPQNGEYTVSLHANASNGCSATFLNAVTIFSSPVADFEITNACIGAPYIFQNSSSSSTGDPIVDWEWNINAGTLANGDSPQFIFTQPGLAPITLRVTSQHGCSGFVEQQIPVWQNPVSDFSNTPEIGEAPFETQFINESTGATQAHWFFGDTHESPEFNPLYTYTLNGTFLAQLVAINNAGCSDTSSRIITVNTPVFDIQLQTLDLTSTDLGQQITVHLVNTGNIPVQQIIFSWQVGNDAPVLEEWNGELPGGMAMDYVFVSHLQLSGQQFPYICVSAETSPLEFEEINKTDNQLCKPIGNTGLEVFPPYPNPGDDRMFIRFITPVEGDLEILVYDVKGTLVMDITDMSVPKGFHQYFIDISALPGGHYKMSLEMGEAKGVVAFMKMNH